MKPKLYFVTCLLFILTACKKDPIDSTTSTQGVTYQQSLSNWQAYKQSVHNNYTYTVITSSWTGISTETKLTITNGSVTGREYKFYIPGPSGPFVTLKDSWTETAVSLNSHTDGAQTITIDEIYAKAKTDWLTADKNINTIYFDTDARGILLSCGYVPKNCADDCFRGITIKDLVGL